MSEILDATAFCKLFGISDATLSRWIARGMPTLAPGGKYGRKYFNVDLACDWMQQNRSYVLDPPTECVSMQPQRRRQAGKRRGARISDSTSRG